MGGILKKIFSGTAVYILCHKVYLWILDIPEYILSAIFFLFPVDEGKVLFTSYFGKQLGDNPKYIYEELLKKTNKVKILWVFDKKCMPKSIPDNISFCYLGTFKYLYHLHTAAVVVDNCRKKWFFKKKNQLYIQTWHGGGGQKKCEKDVEAKLPLSYVQKAKQDSKNIDLMISDSKFTTKLYHNSFWYSGPILECGFPRYDILLKNNSDIRKKVYSYYNIPLDFKLVLYAPTFRVDNSFDAYNIDIYRILNALEKRFESKFVFLIHLHPNVANNESGITYDGERVINSTFYPDTQELIAVSHVLIGDYSSINYDFCLRRLPVFRYAADLEKYKEDRDFYIPYDSFPFPSAANNDQLEQEILNFDEQNYLKELNKFFDLVGQVSETNASAKISDVIIEYCGNSNKKYLISKL